MSKVLASHVLQGKFSTKKDTSLELKENLIKPATFLPQKNACLIEHEENNKVKATSKNVMEFSDSHQTKGKTAISCIGMMIFMTNFSSLCINMNMIITAICSSAEPQPILCQIAIVNNPDWVHWYKSVGGMLYFIVIPTASSRGSSIALLTLLQTLGMVISYLRVTQSLSLTPKHWYVC
jgi:hypothetical protein